MKNQSITLLKEYYINNGMTFGCLYQGIYGKVPHYFELYNISLAKDKDIIFEQFKQWGFSKFLTAERVNAMDKHAMEEEKVPNQSRFNGTVFSNNKLKLLLRYFDSSIDVIYSSDMGYGFVKSTIEPYFRKYAKFKKDVSFLSMIIRTCNGLKTEDFEINNYHFNSDNYNNDFLRADHTITDFLRNGKSGLVLLHGEPGTGKTTYIRQLIKSQPKKRFIYLPNGLADYIADPSFLPMMADNRNSVLILEDSEKLLQVGISNLLNMTDGLLSDCLQMKIIATFNGAQNQIDEALRRPGRLVYEYKFEKLPSDKAKFLVSKYNLDKKIEDEKTYSLADIYCNTDNKQVQQAQKKNRSMGFELSPRTSKEQIYPLGEGKGDEPKTNT